MNPDSTTPVPPTPPVSPVVPNPVPQAPAAPKRTWLWILLLIVGLVLAGTFGAYFLVLYPSQKTATIPTSAPMQTTIAPTPAVTPIVSDSDADGTLEQEINSTVVEEDVSGYSAIETDLRGL